MQKAGLSIPRERWYNNLAWRGNTGAASILIMLSEFLQTRQLAAGEQIFCYVPESGRFTAAYLLFEVEDAVDDEASGEPLGRVAVAQPHRAADLDEIAPPHDPAKAPEGLGPLLAELAAIWHDYRSRVWRTPLVCSVRERTIDPPGYV